MLKICNSCSNNKFVEDFHYHVASKKYVNTCKECISINRRKSYKQKVELSGRVMNSTHCKNPTKTCVKCNTEKDLNSDNFSNQGGHYMKICRICSDIFKRPDRAKIVEDFGKTQICTGCNTEKEVTECFYFSPTNDKYRAWCIDCHAKWSKENKKTEYSVLAHCKAFDNKNEYEIDIDLDYIIESLSKPCTYCEFPSTGLDRLNNSKGHTKDNCVPCCKECNTAKMHNFTYEEMKIIGMAIREVKLKRQDTQ